MVGETLLYVIALLFAVMLLVILGQKLRIAYPVFLVIGGLLISQIPGAPRSGISPDLIFLIFLPPLLYEAAWFTSWPNFWRMRWPIGLHGFGLVIVTSVIVAFVSEKLVPRFTLSIGLLLGGIISPPDAVAASSVLKFFKIPKKVKTVLEGESLVNDAASLTVFRFALAAVISGNFVFHKAAVSFVIVTVLGIMIGLVIAQIIYYIHKLFVTTSNIATAFTLITPYIMYLTCGTFSCVRCTRSCKWRIISIVPLERDPELQVQVAGNRCVDHTDFYFKRIDIYTDRFATAADCFRPQILFIEEAISYSLIITGLIIAIRIVWMYAATYLPLLVNKKLRERNFKTQMPVKFS